MARSKPGRNTRKQSLLTLRLTNFPLSSPKNGDSKIYRQMNLKPVPIFSLIQQLQVWHLLCLGRRQHRNGMIYLGADPNGKLLQGRR